MNKHSESRQPFQFTLLSLHNRTNGQRRSIALLLIAVVLVLLVLAALGLGIAIGRDWLMHLGHLYEVMHHEEVALLLGDATIPQTAARIEQMMIVLGGVLTAAVLVSAYGAWLLYRDAREQLLETHHADLVEASLLMALNRVSKTLTSTLDIDEVLNRILSTMSQVVPHDTATVILVDQEMISRVARIQGNAPGGYMEWVTSVKGAVDDRHTWRIMREKRYGLRVADTRTYEGWFEEPETHWIRSHIGAPMFVGENLVGFLHVNSRQPSFYSTVQVQHVQVFADQAAVAIRNAQLYGDMRRREARLELLVQVARIGTSSGTLFDLAQALTSIAAHIVGSDGCFITGWNEDTGQAVHLATFGSERNRFLPHAIPLHQDDVTKTLECQRQTLIINDVMDTPYVDPGVAKTFPAKSVLALPLMDGTRFLGALILSFKELHTFTTEEVRWAEQAAEVIALAIARGTAFNLLEQHVAERTERLRAANAELVRLSSLKDEFISNVSHELRTPLTSIKVYHALLEKNPGKSETYLDNLQRETDRLQTLIEDLLELGQLEQGRVSPTFTVCDTRGLVKDYLADRQALAEAAGITTVVDLPEAPLLIEADPVLLERVLNILYSNAMNYNVRGATVTVSLTALPDHTPPSVVLRVTDDGDGVPNEEMDLLFDRFYRGKAVARARTPGTGLGLSIAWEITALHHGTITVENRSAPDHGAVFTVTLPTAQNPPGDEVADLPSPSA